MNGNNHECEILYERKDYMENEQKEFLLLREPKIPTWLPYLPIRTF